MFAAIGLALLTGPFLTLPPPAFGGDPTLVALASDPAQMRLYCFSTRCGDEEWRLALAPPSTTDAIASDKRKVTLPGARRQLPLSAPASRRDYHAGYSNDWRIGARYGVQALRNGSTQLGLQLGAGYRLAPLHDDGIQRPGPVFRGEINLGHRIGERAHWSQRVQVEAGEGERFIKQAFALDVELAPAWTLESDFTIRHDSRGASGTETAESSILVRRRF